MSDPSLFHPDLTQDRLRRLARVIVEARRDALPLHDAAAGETNLSLGTRTRERACQAYRLLKEEVDWLDCFESGYYFVLLVGRERLPIKFHRADPSDPPERVKRVLPVEEVLKQRAFAFMGNEPQAKVEEAVDHSWRLLFQDDPETREVFSVVLVRFGDDAAEERWDIDLTEPVSTPAPMAAELPEAAELDRPDVTPLAPPAEPKTRDGE